MSRQKQFTGFPKGKIAPCKKHCLFCGKSIKIGLWCAARCHQEVQYEMKKYMPWCEQTTWEWQIDEKELTPLVKAFPDLGQIYGITYHFRMTDAKRTKLEMWKNEQE